MKNLDIFLDRGSSHIGGGSSGSLDAFFENLPGTSQEFLIDLNENSGLFDLVLDSIALKNRIALSFENRILIAASLAKLSYEKGITASNALTIRSSASASVLKEIKQPITLPVPLKADVANSAEYKVGTAGSKLKLQAQVLSLAHGLFTSGSTGLKVSAAASIDNGFKSLGVWNMPIKVEFDATFNRIRLSILKDYDAKTLKELDMSTLQALNKITD